MKEGNFIELTPKERIYKVNRLLEQKETNDLQKAAKHVGMNYSSFTKLMQEGDYFYLKRENRYCRFVRDEAMLRDDAPTDSEEVQFIREHFEAFKSLIQTKEFEPDFHLDRRITRPSGKLVSKNIRVPEDVYEEFLEVCNERFSYLKLQDIYSQLILDFAKSYKEMETQ